MNEEIKISFQNAHFHIKEFQQVYILENYRLVFYAPNKEHLQTKEGKELKIKQDKATSTIKQRKVDKTQAQQYIHDKNAQKEQAINALNLDAKNINTEFKKLQDSNFEAQISTQTQQARSAKFSNYDIFYDVYTQNTQETLNQKFNIAPKGFMVRNGVAIVEERFFQKCFNNGVYHIIPRLIHKDGKESDFDPIPLEDKGFIITDFRNAKKENLTFQRKIARVVNPNFKLQAPNAFARILDENTDFSAENKIEQAEGIIYASTERKEIAKQKCKEMGFNSEKLKALKEKDKRFFNAKEQSVLGYYTFMENMEAKIARYRQIATDLKQPSTPRKASKRAKVRKSLAAQDTTKAILAKDIGDAGEYVATKLFAQGSTRHLINRRKLDANFNTDSFNYTIPDFLITINDYPALVEIKNVQTQALSEQISFELKLAREYELDYIFLCNHYTKLSDSIVGAYTKGSKGKGTRAFDKDIDKGARSGFIYHRHMHRSIKSAFKEMYIHHIKGVAPNKIIVRRLDLNNPLTIEDEFNARKHLQKGR